MLYCSYFVIGILIKLQFNHGLFVIFFTCELLPSANSIVHCCFYLTSLLLAAYNMCKCNFESVMNFEVLRARLGHV